MVVCLRHRCLSMSFHMDMLAGGIADEKIFYDKVDSLAFSLAQFFGDRTSREYARMLRDARKDGDRYQLMQGVR